MKQLKFKDLPVKLQNHLKSRKYKSRQISVSFGNSVNLSPNLHAPEYDNFDYSYVDSFNLNTGKSDLDINSHLKQDLEKKNIAEDQVVITGDRLHGYAALMMTESTFDKNFGDLATVSKMLTGSADKLRQLAESMNKQAHKGPQFNRKRPGSLYDRGAADSYYHRARKPHWYPNGTGSLPMVVDLTHDEIKEYNEGYDDNESSGIKKEWD